MGLFIGNLSQAVKYPVLVGTTAALPANTAAGASTLTANANGALPGQDGVALALRDRILVKDEAAGEKNGIYAVTDLGSAGTPWVLTRVTDFNSASNVIPGSTIIITSGATLADTYWELATNGTIVVGTTSLSFVYVGGVNTVDGSGTANKISKWQDANTLTDSSITDNGTKLTIALGQIEMRDAQDNLFIGEDSGSLVTVAGFANTSLGVYSQLSVTDGDNNCSLGYQSLYSNQVGDNNIAVGYGSLYTNTASDNIGIGYRALYANTTAIYGIAIGNYALEDHQTGNRNIAIGHESLANEVTGASNVAIGYQSMFDSNGASNNVAIGDLALANNTIGSQNTSLGGASLLTNTSGNYITAIGYGSLGATATTSFSTGIGGLSLEVATGERNTALGYSSGRTLTTGTSNLFLGYLSGNHASQKVNAVNSIAIGANTYTTLSNSIVLGDTSITAVGIGTFAPTANLHIVQQVQATGTVKGFIYTGAINTNQTASTEINGALWTTAGRQWDTGGIATQREFHITGPTYSFVGPSTITNSYTLYVAPATAGTNATITNNYAAGFAGNVWMSGNLTASNVTGNVANFGFIRCFQGATTSNWLDGSLSIGTTTTPTARLEVTDTVATSGAKLGFDLNGAIHTGQTASTEISYVQFGLVGRQWNTGAIGTQRELLISQPTYSFVGPSTITTAATMAIAGAPIAGANATITTSLAFWIQAGTLRFDGDIVSGTKGIDTTAGDSAIINATCGRFRKDTSGAVFTLTNSYITANSIINLTPANAAIDATATNWTVSAGAGSATITFNAAPTANFDMNFIVIN